MEALAARFVNGLRGGRADPDVLATAGETDPPRAALAFERALTDPDLGAHVALWAPELLACARPGFGAESLYELSRAARARQRSHLAPSRLPGAARLLGSSNFLARLLVRHPELAGELDGDPPGPPSREPPAADWPGLRSAKYRGLIRVAARDLAGRSFEESLAELSDLADGCLVAALELAARETGVPPPALFALGKLGGRELNFSSDVDLLFVYEEPEPGGELARSHAVERLVRVFKRNLEQPGEDGFAYRVDLDLRPEGDTGALATPVSVALDYYEGFGAEWERQMLLRLRPLAGPVEVARAFELGVEPFVYRRSIDPGTLRAVRAMKARIEEERRAQRRDLDADLKEGPGGIRDVEFLVQALQLFYAGTHVELRGGNVLRALDALGRLGVLEAGVACSLADAYLWLRRAEHALQLAEERQVHAFPRDPKGQVLLARRMGYRDASASRARDRLLEDWSAVRTQVREPFEALVLREPA
jgi:glutamate-ammonia-ligase adenylyltransferase